ncbi:TetR/AcrR family transcriptional regulator [Methylocystis sp.]|uniref:TetR/AcrR family transcriptional regulator n=1 Tax=Methylocystis sp. TaxID=1911079 RepID=UPI0025E760D6|nr:TetR/AcrR family transcriptional regulator [Methylocystis sp.]
MSRFRKEDWLTLGAKLLAEEGSAALTIDRLTAVAQRTRGSFYHHFEDRDAFLRAMMERWRAQVIDEAGKRYEQAQSANELRRLMREQPMALDHRFERALRRFAASEPIVRQAVSEVDAKRIEGLACVLSYIDPDLSDPQSAAFLQYAALVGLQWLLDDADDPRMPGILEAGNRIFRLDDGEAPASKKTAQEKKPAAPVKSCSGESPAKRKSRE